MVPRGERLSAGSADFCPFKRVELIVVIRGLLQQSFFRCEFFLRYLESSLECVYLGPQCIELGANAFAIGLNLRFMPLAGFGQFFRRLERRARLVEASKRR